MPRTHGAGSQRHDTPQTHRIRGEHAAESANYPRAPTRRCCARACGATDNLQLFSRPRSTSSPARRRSSSPSASKKGDLEAKEKLINSTFVW